MTVVLFFCAVFTLITVWYMMHPLFVKDDEGSVSEQDLSLRGLLDQRERCSQVLRDLELDRETQKIQESDFLHMYSQVQEELTRIDERVRSTKGE